MWILSHEKDVHPTGDSKYVEKFENLEKTWPS